MTQTVKELREALLELEEYLPTRYSPLVVDRMKKYSEVYVRKVRTGAAHNVPILMELLKLAREQRAMAQKTAP